MNFNQRLTNVLTAVAILTAVAYGLSIYVEGLNYYSERLDGWFDYQRQYGDESPMDEPIFNTMYYIKSGLMVSCVASVPLLIFTSTVSFLLGSGFKPWHKA